MPKFEIKNRWNGELIFSIETDSWRLAVEAAIKAKADLRSADLSSANLRSANLRSADLSSANLRSADLSSANLSSADLSYADLRSANLRSANLRSANLRYANLSYANLSYADLRSANLSYADLRSAKIDDDAPIETGETWKDYKTKTVPALLQAGGKALLDVVNTAWDCHDWTNCPMAVAFSVHAIEEIPILYRPRAEQFIKYFDAKMLKKEEIIAAMAA